MADENLETELQDDLEVELVDDTPPADQNRKPLPESVAKRLDDDDDDLDGDVEEVRRKAKEKLSIAKKAWHDERRAKEEALRVADEAANLARGYQARSLTQQKQLVTGEAYLITQMQDKAKKEVEAAKRVYKEAYESGDSDALADAQELLSRATANAIQVEGWRPTQESALQQLEHEVKTQPQAAPVARTQPTFDERAEAWARQNSWYGEDAQMTDVALRVHKKLVADGVDPTSDEYYTTIDGTMRERFPEAFNAPRSNGAPRTATVVASVQRSAKGKKITLTQTQASLAKRLGLTNEQYARELIKTREYANG
jgi:hypothetical protein